MNWVSFFGHFHPLLVHLPIGILLLAILFDWLSYKKEFKKLKHGVKPALLIGALAGLASCVTGYLLSQTGEYNSATVSWHQWLAIVTTILSFAYWQMKKQKASEAVSKTFSVVILILLSVTGHLGGSLTHGENYLTENLFQQENTIEFSSLDLTKALYYKDLVQPILSGRCYSCHGEAKQKGKLRLDQADYILKGGKSGNTVVAMHPDESEMINRLLLPMDDKKHMPPKEKPQPSQIEIEILKNWITSGVDFNKSVQSLSAMKPLQKILSASIQIDYNLDAEVPAANETVLSRLRKYNVVIQSIADGNNHLSANLINAQPMDSAIAFLPEVKNQLVWLKANSSKIKDADLEFLSKLTGLRKLDLSTAAISDNGISQLKNLINLTSLNLSNTSMSLESIKQLVTTLKLKEIFLFGTKVTEADVRVLRNEYPSVIFETGNYVVPTLASDTTIVKPPKQ